ncbi:HalOD1 output domain-containing protein [Haloprofundus salinisoli]|uniref:HalOD1 output domain-containing protein n=1 Tax=Haloprofundus salinisoli TaxID=2876193 RepID=UPI001CCD97AA|nr:HalOD1 output domain-containing protein [Haloprofundus salinisoli]
MDDNSEKPMSTESPKKKQRRVSKNGETAGEDWTFETQAHYDPDEQRDLTTVIIGTIAEVEGVEILDIKVPPLYEVVDTESVEDTLFGRPEATRNGTQLKTEFRYRNHKVEIDAEGWVTVFSPVEKPLTDEE